MSKETDSLLPCTGRLEHPERPPRRTWPRVGLVALVLTLCALLYTRTSTQASVDLPKLDTLVDAWTGGTEDLCPQHAPYVPEGTAAGAGATALAEPRASELAQLLSGAVQVDTSVGDAWPPVRDAPGLWDSIFAPFRMYLASALPALHAAESPIKLTRVNEHGLLYTWTGTNTQLGPLLLMAHQDVVPVEPSTWGAWAYPPFSGHITEEGNIFGRGTEDTKSSLVTILAALQSLLQANWTPQRTILVSFGFDEEAAGTEGAGALARHIESVYGPGSIAMLIDEGGEFTLPDVDAGVPATASPAVSEKGYLDVSLTVATPGGHSSVPPVHTGIGLLAQAVVAVEAHADDAVLRSAPGSGPEHSHGWDELLCGVAFGKIRGPLKRALLRLHYAQLHPPSDGVPRGGYEKMLNVLRAQALDLMDPHQRVLFTTTQAVDLIAGGVKVNALPESVTAIINHRIEPGAEVRSVREHIATVLAPVAREAGLGLDAWGMANLSVSAPSGRGAIVLEDAFSSALEPAPPTPVDGAEAAPWRLLAGVIRSVWPDGLDGDGRIVVHPSLSIGNTDCKSFYTLAKHVFRFSPSSIAPPTPEIADLPPGWGAHTVNEHLHQDALVFGWQFFTTLIQAADKSAF